MPEVTLTRPQTEFFTSPAEYVAAVAGFGSGKTQVAVYRILAGMFKYPTINYAYLAPTYPLIRDIFYPKIAEVLNDMGINFKINHSNNIVQVAGLGQIFCRTMERPDLIVGWECGDAVMDEFDVLTFAKAYNVFRKVSARCRQPFPDGKVNQKLVTTTPEGFKATYKMFKKEPLVDSHLIQMSTYSNAKNLPDGYIKGLEDQYPEQLIKAYLGGQFVNLTSGTVYYSFIRELHNTHYVAKPRETLHIGQDFNVYKMASIIHIIREGKAYAVDELIDLRDTADVIETLKENYDGHPIIIYPDASGKSTSSKGASLSDIKLFKDAGFRVKARNKNPLIKNRVLSVNTGFEKGKYFVNVEKCPFYAECLEQQVYDVTGKPTKDGILDNPVDAGGYFMHYKFPVIKQEIRDQAMGGF